MYKGNRKCIRSNVSTSDISKMSDDRIYCIYCITSPSNKKYVGQTCQTIQARWWKHKSDARNPNVVNKTPLHRAISKYGETDFRIEILENSLTIFNVDDRERHWIIEMNTLQPFGYNVLPGGQDGLHRLKCVGNPIETATKVDRKSLPLYINFMYDSRGYHGYIVRDTGKNAIFKQKSFHSGKRSLEETLEAAKEYLRQYVPERDWIYESKYAHGKCVTRESKTTSEVMKELDRNVLPRFIYIGCTKQKKHYIKVTFAAKDNQFASKTFYPNENKTLTDCLNDAEGYLESHIPRDEWIPKKIMKTSNKIQKKVQRPNGGGC